MTEKKQYFVLQNADKDAAAKVLLEEHDYFYHGTPMKNAASIHAKGIDPDYESEEDSGCPEILGAGEGHALRAVRRDSDSNREHPIIG